MQPENPSTVKHSQIFGRQKSRPLSTRQKLLINELLPQLMLHPDTIAEELHRDNKKQVWLEIGFGGGEHLVWQAQRHPEIKFIGCEPYINGMAKLLVLIEENDLKNIRVHDGDAAQIIEALAPATIDRAFVLYPDPWPKKRHHKRRFLSPANFRTLASILKPGSQLRIATDIGDYARAILATVRRSADFIWQAKKPEDWRNSFDDWPSTRYEQKAKKAGRKCYYLLFERK